MIRVGSMPSAAIPPLMNGDALAAVEDLDAACRRMNSTRQAEIGHTMLSRN
ncbi:hypothetical protein LJR235_005270 [Pararhizobium sp. LjRoot235]|uniref:hypothetical protein n=1 Tax=Pararhizobium sp. LjRoot235 TaxID=3342291 RepID=UPI003ECFACBD